MKIFQVISSLGNGGAEKLVVELSNELAADNDLTIISIKKVENWMYPARKIGSKVRLIQLNKKKGFDLSVLYKLLVLLKNEMPDIVHIHLTMPLYYLLLLIPVFKKTVFYHTIHSTFAPHEKLFRRLNLIPFYRRVINICLSRSIFEQFRTTFPQLTFSCIENGIKKMSLSVCEVSVKEEMLKFRTDSNSRLMLFVGRLVYQKGITLLLDIFTECQLYNAKLVLIGNGTSELIDQIHIASSRSEGRIVFLGPKENIADYMRQVDALILASKYEGLPIVLIEAISMGLPVLSTPVGGVPDVITDGANGFLAKSTQKQDILEIIQRFINLEKQEIDKMRENNIRLFNEKYSINKCADRHLELYRIRQNAMQTILN